MIKKQSGAGLACACLRKVFVVLTFCVHARKREKGKNKGSLYVCYTNKNSGESIYSRAQLLNKYGVADPEPDQRTLRGKGTPKAKGKAKGKAKAKAKQVSGRRARGGSSDDGGDDDQDRAPSCSDSGEGSSSSGSC